MKQFLYLPVFFCLWMTVSSSFGQQRFSHPDFSAIAKPSSTQAWIHFREDVRLDPETLFQKFPQAFGLKKTDQMKLNQFDTDQLGFSHYRYQLYHRNVPIEGADFIVHAKNGVAIKANGLIPDQVDLATTPAIDHDQALSLALDHMKADSYMWENPANEKTLKYVFDDPNASFYPTGELLISDADFDPQHLDYHLVWKFEIYAARPHSKKWIYVDALQGTILKELETLHTANSVGTATTKYSGVKQIVTDSTGQNYRLRESRRGESASYDGVDIETFDMNQGIAVSSAVDFVDDDNNWNNVNPQLDEAATDVHWGTEMVMIIIGKHMAGAVLMAMVLDY